MNRVQLAVAGLVLSVAVPSVSAQSGVLVPLNATQPDASVLSLEEMTVDVTIDDGDARVFITQIFSNHTNRLLPPNASSISTDCHTAWPEGQKKKTRVMIICGATSQ